MSKLTIKTAIEDDFFQRGRQLARAADRGEALPSESAIGFENPADVVKLITTARLALFRAIKEMPGSITQISERLHRDRSAVKRDVDELARAGLVTGLGEDPARSRPDEGSSGHCAAHQPDGGGRLTGIPSRTVWSRSGQRSVKAGPIRSRYGGPAGRDARSPIKEVVLFSGP